MLYLCVSGLNTSSSVRFTCFCADLEIKQAGGRLFPLLPLLFIIPKTVTGAPSEINAKAAETAAPVG